MVDVLVDMDSILTTNWTAVNTNNRTPIISPIFSYKKADLGRSDYVLLYTVDYTEKPISIGDAHKETSDSVSIDVRTVYSRAHAIAMKDEVIRIVDAKRKNPSANFQYVLPVRYLDLSDKMTGIWRFVIDVKLTNWAKARGS